MRPSVRGLAAASLAAAVVVVAVAADPTTAQPQVPASQSGGGRGMAPVVTMQPMRPPATGNGAISGVVTDAATKRPVTGALVRISGGPPGELRPRQMTDNAGRYIFTELPAPADYTLSAMHPDYLTGGYTAAPGQETTRVALVESQWFPRADLQLQLFRPASLSGTVFDERGEPVVGVPVRILKLVTIGGHTRRATGPVVETDDRGMYRAAELAPGSYVVHVPSVQITLAEGSVRPPTPPQRSLAIARAAGGLGAIIGHFPTPPVSGRGYAMAYHPATPSADEALPIALDYGESRANVDVQLTLVPTVRVSGTLTGSLEAIASMPVWLVPAGDETAGAGGEVASTLSTAAGAFTFLNVPSGRYTLIASRSQSEYSAGGGAGRGSQRLLPERGSVFNVSMVGGRVAGVPGLAYATRGRAGGAAFGRQAVAVDDRDIANLVVPVTSGVRVSGLVLWDGRQEAPAGLPAAPMIGLEPADGDLSLGFPQSGFVSLSGQAPPTPITFAIDGVLPGRYLLGTTLLAGSFSIEGAEWRGRDLLSSPLEVSGDGEVSGVVVRFTTKTSRLSGTVRDTNGAPATSGSVIVFPASPAAWDAIGFTARRFASVPVGAGGVYVHTQLPPGDYLVSAISAADRSKWLDREFLSTAASAAARVRIEPGAMLAQDLRMPGDRR